MGREGEEIERVEEEGGRRRPRGCWERSGREGWRGDERTEGEMGGGEGKIAEGQDGRERKEGVCKGFGDRGDLW